MKDKNQATETAKQFKNPLNAGYLRNKICPCGNGKKAKKCHGKEWLVSLEERTAMLEIISRAQVAINEILSERN